MTLDEAQLAKMEMIGRKLDLKPGILDKILDKSGFPACWEKNPLIQFVNLAPKLRFGCTVDLAQTSKFRVAPKNLLRAKRQTGPFSLTDPPPKQRTFRSSNFQPTQNLPGFNLYISYHLGLFSKVWSFWRLVLVLAAWPIFWPPSTMSRSRQWHCPKHRWYPGSQRRVVDFSSFERCFRAEIVRILRIL